MRLARLLLPVLAIALVATTSQAADLPAVQVFDDPTGDHALWVNVDPAATPPLFDLVAGSIAETKDTIDFTWQYADIPDGTNGGLFEGHTTYWEFSLRTPGGAQMLYSLRARPYYPAGLGVHAHCNTGAPVLGTCTGFGPGGGVIQGNCTTTGTVISCSTIPGSLVTVTADDAANTITAHVRRLDLRDNAGNFIGVDGSVLEETEIFQGIASCQGVVLNSAANCDVADQTIIESYTLGVR
jgi:hypothetical protein